MQKKFALASIAVAGLATAASAQIRLSHSLEEFLVTAGAGVACAAGTGALQTTADNQFSRSFTLTDFGVTEGFTVSTVEFGVETLRLPSGTIIGDVTVNLYQIPAGSDPILGGMLVGSVDLVLDPTDLEVIIVDIDGSIAAGSALMVEISLPDYGVGGDLGDAFFIGGNGFGENEPSFLASAACGLFDPAAVGTLGAFPDSHWIILAEGDVGGGSTCRVDLDGDMALTIFDFLLFSNLFDAGDLGADFDGDMTLTIFDFLVFSNEFDAGCTF